MTLRGLTLSLAALLAFLATAESAHAAEDEAPRPIILAGNDDPGPPILRHIPGLRIFFGDYAMSEEEFDARYGTGDELDESYYEPEPLPPKKKQATAKPPQPAPKKKVAAKPAAAKGLSCTKAAEVVAGYGFTAVTPATCTGKRYAFNAMRDGKAFTITLNPATGALTDVKKQP